MAARVRKPPPCPPAGHSPAPYGTKGPCPTCKRRRCHGKARDGGRCRLFPVSAALVCRSHGAAKGTKGRAAAERRVQHERAVAATATYGRPVEVDPGNALLQEVHRTQGHVAWLAGVVASLPHDTAGPARYVEVGRDDDGRPIFQPTSAVKQMDSGGRYERPAVWIELYQQERRHLVQVTRAALEAGVQQQLVDLAQEYADMVRTLVDGLVRDLGRDPDDEDVRQVVHRRLMLVHGGQAAS